MSRFVPRIIHQLCDVTQILLAVDLVEMRVLCACRHTWCDPQLLSLPSELGDVRTRCRSNAARRLDEQQGEGEHRSVEHRDEEAREPLRARVQTRVIRSQPPRRDRKGAGAGATREVKPRIQQVSPWVETGARTAYSYSSWKRRPTTVPMTNESK